MIDALSSISGQYSVLRTTYRTIHHSEGVMSESGPYLFCRKYITLPTIYHRLWTIRQIMDNLSWPRQTCERLQIIKQSEYYIGNIAHISRLGQNRREASSCQSVDNLSDCRQYIIHERYNVSQTLDNVPECCQQITLNTV